MLWGVFVLKCSVFQKNYFFSRFSINRKCDKNLGYNLHGLISARLVLDRSKLILDRSNLIFDQSKFGLKVFKKSFFSHVFFTLFNFPKSFLLSLFDWSTSNLFFVIFFLSFLKGFCLQVSVCPFYPFFFFLFTYFMHFRCNFRTYWILGF